MDFQDPTSALNARQTVYEAVAEGVRIQKLPGDEEQLVAAALARAGLRPPERFFARYASRIPPGCRFHPRWSVVASGEAERPGIEGRCCGRGPRAAARARPRCRIGARRGVPRGARAGARSRGAGAGGEVRPGLG